MVLRIYLDVCCLNRPFDDQTQDRIHLESEAVILILKKLEAGIWEWVGSEVLDLEVRQTPDRERRERVLLLVRSVHRCVAVGHSVLRRAQQLEKVGFGAFDALHVACAEDGEADVLLTTDDQLLVCARHNAGKLRVAVENPLT